MSLTADQITAKNFKKFYEELRPYLNGTPPTYANMFNRSDLYSTDEKIVGCWVDGKPLYQKTIDCGTLPNASDKSVATNIANLDRLVTFSGCAVFPDWQTEFSSATLGNLTTESAIIGWIEGNVIKIRTGGNRTNGTAFVTLKYTKTTDTAIKVGTGNDYSTDEQIVGTWIDGKPIYQKTVELGTLPNTSSKTVAHGISNLNEIVEIKGIAKSGTSFIQLGKSCVSAGNLWALEVEVVGNNVVVHTGADRTSWTGVCTLRYTKTV